MTDATRNILTLMINHVGIAEPVEFIPLDAELHFSRAVIAKIIST